MVASCLALQLAGTLHLAVVRHAICAEHGEAIDVGEDGHARPKPAAKSGTLDTSDVIAEAHPSPAGESHRHCPLDEDRSTHALGVHAALIGPRLASPTPVAEPHAPLARLTPRALQRLAPKTSPPA